MSNNNKRNRRKSMNLGKMYQDNDDGPQQQPIVTLESQAKEYSVKVTPRTDSVPTTRTAIGKRKKIAKVPFDPSKESMNPGRRRSRASIESSKDGDAVRPLAIKKPKVVHSVCVKCKTAAKHEVVYCRMCLKARIHLECRELKSFSEHWYCKECQDILSRYESAYNSSAPNTHTSSGSNTVKRIRNMKRSRKPCLLNGFAGFSKQEVQIDNKDLITEEPKSTTAHQQTTENHGATANIILLDSPPSTSSLSSENTTTSGYSSSNCQSVRSEDVVSTNDSIPNADDWTTEQVFHYFQAYFPENAFVFRDLNIDGATLMQMKCKDVLRMRDYYNEQSLSSSSSAAKPVEPLYLGDVFKIFSHVVRLQTKNNDMTLCWRS